MASFRYPAELFREDFIAYTRLNEARRIFCESERHWNFGRAMATVNWTYGISWEHRRRIYPRWICQECYEELPSREVARAVEMINGVAESRPAASSAPVSDFQSLILAASNCPAKSKLSFAEHFKELLTMSSTGLSRVKGDWKKTLTAQVVKFARRKGAIEEFSFVDCGPGSMIIAYATIKSPRVQDGTN